MFIGRTIELHIDLGKSEVLQLLATKTIREPSKDVDNLFVGHFHGGEFELKRDIRYQNGFLPVFRGRITAVSSGSRIEGELSLSDGTSISLYLWWGGMGAALLVAISMGSLLSASFAIPAALLGWIYSRLIRRAFNPEADTIEQALMDMFSDYSPRLTTNRTGIFGRP
jgi:hypothetical protein